MESVSLFDAWRLWLEGNQLTDLRLGWWSILWWGRAGKILMAGAIVTLLLEIIGPETLRQLGESLRKPYWDRSPLVPARRLWDWGEDMFRVTIEGREITSFFPRTTITWLIFGACALVSLGFGSLLYQLWSSWDFNGGWEWKIIPIAVLSLVAVTSIIIFGLLALLVVPPLALSVIIIAVGAFGSVLALPVDALARGLDRHNLNLWIKLFTAIVIIIGFHFDLLAS